MLMYLLILIAVSYAIFVFTSGFFNPFVIVKAPLKQRSWRLGRAAAVASFVAGILAVIMLEFYNVSSRGAVASYLILLGLFITPSIMQYRKSSIWR